MKLLSILSEASKSKFTPIELKYMAFFYKKDYTDDDGKTIFNYLKDDVGLDYEKAITLTNLYLKNWSGDASFLINKKVDRTPWISDDTKLMALALFLKIPPFTLEEDGTHYGLTQYITEDGDYCIGTDDECDTAYEQALDNAVDSPEEMFNANTLEGCIDASDSDKHMIAQDMTNNYVDDMDDDTILEDSGKQDELNDYEEEINTLENHINELHDAIADNSRKKERRQLKIELAEKEKLLNTKNEGLDSYKDNLIEEGRESLRESLYDDYYNQLDRDFAGYMTGDLGYDIKSLIEQFGVDDECLKDILRNNGSRENELSNYDGKEDMIKYNGVTYYIYRTN